jgi:integrase
MASIDKRRGKWRAQVRRNGQSLTRTFVRKMDADAWVREADIAIDQERDPTTRRVSKKDTFASLIDLHIEDLTSFGKRIRRSKEAVLKRLRADLGDLPIASLTRERIVQFGRDRAKEGAGPATLAVDLSFIGTVMTHAAAVHGMQINTESVRLARIALRKIGLVGSGEERDRRPTLDELEKLYAHFDANARLTMPMTRIVKFAIASAMRQDEIFRIEWRHLDTKNRTITVKDRKDPRKKEGNDQRVPLLSATGYDAYALLVEQRSSNLLSSRCFPFNGRSVGASFRRACRDLQIIDLHFHEQVPLVTGHKDWKMLKRYTQLRPENLHAILARKNGGA